MSTYRPIVPAHALRPGDRVALLSLASRPQPDDVGRGAEELRRLGFEPVLGATRTDAAPYVAGAATHRAAQLCEMLRDPDVRAIVATRGGYGSAQLLPYLPMADVRQARKLLIGYSDITALLDAWTGLGGVVSLHGPMVEGRLARGDTAYDRDSFLRAVCDPSPLGAVPTTDASVVRAGWATGRLRGGTLTQLAALAGTPWAFRSEEPTVLFLDDVNERPYRLDRLLWQLEHAGMLAQVTGIVFNELPGCDEPGGAVTGLDAVRHALHAFHGPIVAGVRSGHTTGAMLSLPFGVACTLEAGSSVRLSIDGPAVALT